MQLLDAERCEFLLVGAADDLHAELGGEGAGVAAAAAQDAAAACGADSDEECLLGKMREEIQAEVRGLVGCATGGGCQRVGGKEA